jgi:hypothetical protein
MAVTITNWLFAAAIIIQSLHLVQINKRHMALQRRVFELEMERDFPGFRRGTSG